MARHENNTTDGLINSKRKEAPHSTPEQDAKMVEQFLKKKEAKNEL